jgi:hypothetical protein
MEPCSIVVRRALRLEGSLAGSVGAVAAVREKEGRREGEALGKLGGGLDAMLAHFYGL